MCVCVFVRGWGEAVFFKQEIYEGKSCLCSTCSSHLITMINRLREKLIESLNPVRY